VNDFATATVTDLFGTEAVKAARLWEVTESRSGVLLSTSDGTHRFVPLPVEAQLAPVGAIGVDDVDRDGALDLVLGQNSRAPVPSIGRFEEGWVWSCAATAVAASRRFPRRSRLGHPRRGKGDRDGRPRWRRRAGVRRVAE
jgi:hypothetical protein